MKAQTKALVASVVVIALALSAVSGITYSWFTDSEQSEIDISTAVVNYEVTWATTGSGSGKTTWTVTNGNVTVAGLDANDQIPVVTKIENKSTIKTVYRIVATATLAEGHGYTLYDLKNIYIGGVQLNATGDANGNITLAETVIADWTELSVGSDPSQQNIYITTPQSYGGGIGAQIVAYDPSTGEGSTSKDGTYTEDWTQSTEKEGLSISLSIVAVQGDYPYSKMTTSEKVGTAGNNAVAAMIPENKVLKADSIQSSGGSGEVSNVIVDFSNVSTIDDSKTGISTQNKVQVDITSVNQGESTVALDLTLWTVTEAAQTTTTQVQNPEFDSPVVITMTVPGAIYDPMVVYNGDNTDGTVLSSTVNGSNEGATTTIVFSVTHFSNYVIKDASIIISEDELIVAMEKGGSYKLGADLENTSKTISVGAPVVLDMKNHKISTGSVATLIQVNDDLEIFDGTLTNTYTTSARVLAIESLTSDVTLSLKNVDIVGPTSGTDDRGISVYGNTAGVEIDISGGSVKTYHYPLCVADGNSDVLIYVENAAIEGYSVTQTNSIYTKMIFDRCTLDATNNEAAGSNDYSAFVFYEKANGSRITCYDCEVNATKKNTADQELITFYTNSFVEFNGCTVKVNGSEVPGSDVNKSIGSHVLAYPGAGLEVVAGYDAATTYTEEWLQVVAWKTVTDQGSLTDAVNAGGYVIFSDNITGNVVIQKDAYVILNLRGHTLTASSSPAIENKGILELVDSNFPKWGTVKCTNSNGNIIKNDDGGELYFQGGEFSKSTNGYLVENNGVCTIDWGGFVGSLDEIFNNNDGASMSIEGGYFDQKPEEYIPDGYEAESDSSVPGYSWTVVEKS